VSSASSLSANAAVASPASNPSASRASAGADPYAAITPLSSASRNRAALTGVLIALALVGVAALVALLFVSAVFDPGSVK
jgi:hypothetical protein